MRWLRFVVTIISALTARKRRVAPTHRFPSDPKLPPHVCTRCGKYDPMELALTCRPVKR